MSSATPPTEYFPGINFNPSFYNLGSSAVSLDYLNSNFLRSTGYAISRAQFTLFNGSVDINENLDVSGNINASAYLVNNVPVSFSQWTTTGNDIYYAGKVGIGTTTPSSTGAALQINGTVSLSSSANTSFFWSGFTNTLIGRANTAGTYSSSAGVGDLVLSSNNKIIIKSGASTNPIAMCVDTSNNVGIGKTNPSATYKLDVSGNINANKFFRDGTELTQYTDTDVRTVLSTSAGTNMTWNTGTNKFDVAAPYTDTNTRTVLSTSAGTNMTWNTGTNKFDVSVPPSYTDTNVRTVLSTSAGTNMTWNTGTNRFDVAAPYTLPIATSTILGGVKPDTSFTVNATTGVMSLSGASIYLDGASARAFSWSGSTSLLGRATAAQNWSTSAAINDVTLRSSNKLLLQSGTGAAALVIDVSNNVGIGKTNPSSKLDVTGDILGSKIGVGKTSITSGFSLDVSGNIVTSGNINLANTSTSLYWGGTSCNLGRAGFNGDYSTSAAINDIVLRSGSGKLLLQSGVGGAALVIDTANNIGIGTAVPTTGIKLDVRGNIESNGSIGTSSQFYFAGTLNSGLSRNIFLDLTNAPFFSQNDIILRGSNKVHLQSGSSTTIKPGITVDTANNVGIGNTAPTQKLDVGGNILCSGFLQGLGGGGAFRIVRPDAWVRLRDIAETTHLDFAAGQLYSHSTITSVGATNVQSNLTVGGNSNLRNTYIYSSNEGSSIGLYFATPFTGNPLQASKSAIIALAMSSYSRHNLCFCLNTVADNTTNASTNDSYITLSWDGFIQFNKPLIFMVNAWNTDVGGNRRFYFSGDGITYYSGGQSGGFEARMHEWRRTYDDAMIGYFENTGRFRSYGYSSLSDTRIKKNIRDIDDVEGLQKILLVQPKKYNYIEYEKNKNCDIIGFIAQQIDEVIPEAITKSTGIVPNIYKNCSVYNKRNIICSIPLDLEIDTEVIITDTEKGSGGRYKIKEIYNDYFVIDKDIDRDEVFVKGYEIKDLHHLDKNYIYTLNVCATQELYKLIMEQKEEINNLKNRLSILESINNSQ